MENWIIYLMIFLGVVMLIDSYRSYKKGIFREYIKMAPDIYHYKGQRSFIPKILENVALAIFCFCMAAWLCYKLY